MRFLFGIALALGIAAAAYGAAASLTVNGGTAQAGSASAACDGDGVTVSYTVAAGNVTGVTVSGIADACDGADVTVGVDSSDNTEDTSCLLDENTAASVTCTGFSIAVADLQGVTVTIVSD